jgi:serine/threonine protein kinase
MSEVRDAWDLRLERPVAVKLLSADLAANSDIRSRFEREARSVARLRHPHVVSVFDCGIHQGIPFVVLERLPGETLADRIRAGPLSEPWVRRLASEILGALDHAHRAGIVHRDVKPANILLTDEGAAKVADFGIAKTMDPMATSGLATSTNQVLGTIAYLAPERIDGKSATPASDLWSLGVALHEALTGRRPFTGDTPLAEALAARQGQITPLSIRRPDVSSRLAAVIERCLAPAPELRYQSAGAMAQALGVALAGTGPEPSGSGATRGGRNDGTQLMPDMLAVMTPTRPVVGGPPLEPARGAGRGVRGDRPRHQAPRHTARAALAAVVVAVTAAVVVSTGAVGSPASRSASRTPVTTPGRPGPAAPEAVSTTTTTTTTSLPPQTDPSSTAPSAPPSSQALTPSPTNPTSSSTNTTPTSEPPPTTPTTSEPPPTTPTTSPPPTTSLPPGPSGEGHGGHGPPPGHGDQGADGGQDG